MKKTLSSRLTAFVLVFMLIASMMVISVAAAEETASLVSTLSNGDKVVIYYPDSTKALGNTLSGNKIAAVDATVANGKLNLSADIGVFTAEKDNITNCFYFKTTDGKYLTSGATGNSMSLADGKSDLALWSLEEADGGFYVKNYAAVYVAGETSKPQYLEYYNGFTTYSFSASKANLYTFTFYKVESDVPPAPPMDDPSEDSSDVVFSTIADARNGAKDEIFNVKGVVTFVDGKNVVVEDETGAINLYLKAVAEVSVGNKISATGKRGAFNGLEQLTGAEVIEVLEESVALPAVKESTIADVLADIEAGTLECHFVSLKNVTLGATDEATSITVLTDDEGNSINIYRCPSLEIEAGTKVDVVALVSDYKGYQLRIADASDIKLAGTADDTSDDTAEDDKPAKPGDSSTVAVFAIIAMFSTAAVVAVAKKRA